METETDITPAELTASITDAALRAWWEKLELPANFTVNEFFVKSLEAASIAATLKNETLEAGKKILGYPPATNGAISRTPGNQLFFPRTTTIVSRVGVNLDVSIPSLG
jgi:hypothetical protein